MLRNRHRVAPALLAVVLVAGAAAGCGGAKHPKAADSPPASSSASSSPSVTAAPTVSDPLPQGTFSSAAPRQGLPTDFPQGDVPLLAGQVSTQFNGPAAGEPGKKGWVIEVSVAEDPQHCFADAAAALTAHGYTKKGQITAQGTVQAQYTKPHYTVIISAASDGNAGCTLGYEVGQSGTP
ncbi:MAG TPA: hypothetical protein VHZ06_04185 [Marmoricola sp.]|jgi:hypothetical protein|nr:hypothetical protein [Marmoricola sp.]